MVIEAVFAVVAQFSAVVDVPAHMQAGLIENRHLFSLYGEPEMTAIFARHERDARRMEIRWRWFSRGRLREG